MRSNLNRTNESQSIIIISTQMSLWATSIAVMCKKGESLTMQRSSRRCSKCSKKWQQTLTFSWRWCHRWSHPSLKNLGEDSFKFSNINTAITKSVPKESSKIIRSPVNRIERKVQMYLEIRILSNKIVCLKDIIKPPMINWQNQQSPIQTRTSISIQ